MDCADRLQLRPPVSLDFIDFSSSFVTNNRGIDRGPGVRLIQMVLTVQVNLGMFVH